MWQNITSFAHNKVAKNDHNAGRHSQTEIQSGFVNAH